jgi:hypothetical protein
MAQSTGDGESSNSRRLVLLGVFVLLAIAVAIVWRRGPAQPDLAAGRVAADKFLDLIRSGQAAQAWDSTTSEFKSFEGRESLVRSVKKHPELLKPSTFISVQEVKVQDAPRAEYVYRASDGKGTVRLLAGNERNDWRIDRMRIE